VKQSQSPQEMAIRNHSRWRRVWDGVYGALTPCGWPSRLAWKLHPHADVRLEEQTVIVPAPIHPESRMRVRRSQARVRFASS
jgi:hypothetical protein